MARDPLRMWSGSTSLVRPNPATVQCAHGEHDLRPNDPHEWRIAHVTAPERQQRNMSECHLAMRHFVGLHPQYRVFAQFWLETIE